MVLDGWRQKLLQCRNRAYYSPTHRDVANVEFVVVGPQSPFVERALYCFHEWAPRPTLNIAGLVHKENIQPVKFTSCGQAAGSVYSHLIIWMGDRAVDCARLESVCAARHRGFESPPIRHLSALQKLDPAHVWSLLLGFSVC